ncbi:MAG: class I SAM-dependent methyltransferase [Proteobacteria bacterium]|nr:class I SAM-dependent methyltransferase [Pseudomonadota bacterium]
MNEQQLVDCQTIVDNLLNLLPKNTKLVGAELGVKEGYLSKTFLSTNPKLTMHSIDLWGEHSTIPEVHEHENNYNLAKSQLTEFGARSIIKRMLTTDAVTDFEDDSLDFVYIDATHTYEAVKEEIALWSSKVKANGLVTGHDYVPGWAGVIQAVDESILDQTKLHLFSHGVWAISNQYIKKA